MNNKVWFFRGYHLLLILALLATLAVGLFMSMGCDSCADEGEYCVEVDCCGDLACRYHTTEGYRCRP